ncbi:hypothetical protein FRB96_003401 [Tulasnella sp. 330]|nr:hypothetical protein FRB96_003401 [Tulasnella sp. 330]KAG8882471.1 hypothetical protein FRB97_008200 [Tulasnella sp. 331]KAG8888112.1 hypothetical protein FRB98_008378 [Tulasnella sp. 332]
MSLSASNILIASDIAKDTRDFLRARQLQLKPHDRSKTKRIARTHCFESVRPEKQAHGGRKTRQAASDDADDVEAREPLGPLPSSQSTTRTWDEIVRSFDGFDTTTLIEVPLTSLIKPTKPKYVFGADFEFVQRPQRVIVLDDVDEDMDEDEWEYVQDLVPARKLPEPVVEVAHVAPRTSYAAMVKA